MKLLVKYHTDIDPIEFKDGSDWIDLRSAENIELEPNTHYIISLGISVKLPEGYEAHVAPRSSTFKNWGILQTNSVGVIDESYCGNDDVWKMSVFSTRKAKINKNDRICQFRLIKKQKTFEIETVESLSYNNRGGFGHTGIQ